MATEILRYLSGTLTQGSADAFVQLAMDTGIEPENGVGLKIERIQFQGKDTDTAWQVAAAQFMYLALSRDTKTAVPELTDTDCIWKKSLELGMTTSGHKFFPRSFEEVAPDGLIIVEPIVYAQLDSTSFAQALDFDVRLYYSEVKLSEIEILRLLNNV